MEQDARYKEFCKNFKNEIETVHGVDSVKKAAKHATVLLNAFANNRWLDSSGLFELSYEEFFIACERAILSDRARYFSIIESACMVSGALSFIKWKTLSNFIDDQIFIFENFIFPLIKIESLLPANGETWIATNSPKTYLYLPNVRPEAVGVANAVGARELIDQYVKANAVGRTKASLFVGLRRGDSGQLSPHNLEPSVRSCVPKYFSYGDFAILINFIRIIRPTAIIIDYFTYPWNFLPRLIPESKFVYRSMGFNPFITRNCNLIVGFKADSKFDLVTDVIRKKAAVLNVPVDVFKTPRSHVDTRDLDFSSPRYIETQRALSLLKSQRDNVVFSTLCRGTKISRRFCAVVQNILEHVPGSIFCGFGPEVPSVAGFFDEGFRNRIYLFNEIEPSLLYAYFDVYLETFPEHQGMAVVEVLSAGVVAVSLNEPETPHILQNERLSECVAVSEEDYASKAIALLDKNRKMAVKSKQQAVIASAYGDPASIWEGVESAILRC